MNPFHRRLPRVLVAAALLVPLGGCLVHSDRQFSRSGNYVPPAAFDRIKPGKTTAAWVQATLGEPSSKVEVEGGEEVWKWTYTERKNSSGTVFLLFDGSDSKETTKTAYVELKDGVVVRKWRG